MDELAQRILKDGRVLNENVLKVDSFLNHQVDVRLIDQIGQTFFEHFRNRGINKILTVEASGISVACSVARCFHVPMVFARKNQSLVLNNDLFTAEVFSFTKQQKLQIFVRKQFIEPCDRVLLVDDFLARGEALKGLADIVKQSGATLIGAGIVIEKVFQDGGKRAREFGLEVYSLVQIASLDKNQIQFC